MDIKNLLKKPHVGTVQDPGNEGFYECIKDIVHHPYVLQMKDYPHHCETDCYQHCLNVAFFSYKICNYFHLDARSAARAGMLHDLFLYNWHGHRKETGDPVHALTHPRAALYNAKKYFELNKLEEEIILKHMFPVTPIPPVHREAWVITFTDKYCGTCAIGRYYYSRSLKRHVPRGAYLVVNTLLKRILGEDYQYQNYNLPFGLGEAEAAANEVNFVKLRKRSSSGWKKDKREFRRPPKY